MSVTRVPLIDALQGAWANLQVDQSPHTAESNAVATDAYNQIPHRFLPDYSLRYGVCPYPYPKCPFLMFIGLRQGLKSCFNYRGQ